MINSIDEYLKQLRKELTGYDRATIQDALSDAGEYLRSGIENAKESQPDISEIEVLSSVIEEYGLPAEIAAVYKEMESHIGSSLVAVKKRTKQPWFLRFFGVVIDPRAYGALFYLIFSLALGIIYSTWAVTGISLSLGLIILIFGVIFFGIFILSVRGISLIEGRLVEALLGIQMPRRPFFVNTGHGLWRKFKSLVWDKYTWFTLIYMIIMLPLGIIYFVIFITMIILSIWMIFRPVFDSILDAPQIIIGSFNVPYSTPGWLMPYIIIGGIALFILTLHFAKIIGKLHGYLAKFLLVRQ